MEWIASSRQLVRVLMQMVVGMVCMFFLSEINIAAANDDDLDYEELIYHDFGHPIDDEGVPYPNHMERWILTVSNEARNDPSVWPAAPGIVTSGEGPLPPLAYGFELSAAARFHSTDMFINNCFSHDSCDGTSFSQRIGRYYDGPSAGENIAMGQGNARVAVESWMASETGHRENLVSPSWVELGTGYAGEVPGRPHYTQNFGTRPGVKIPPIPAGIGIRLHTEMKYWVNYWDQEGRDPRSVRVIRSDGCYEMDLEAGSPDMGTYYLELPRGNFPFLYYFQIEDAGGDVHYYPEYRDRFAQGAAIGPDEVMTFSHGLGIEPQLVDLVQREEFGTSNLSVVQRTDTQVTVRNHGSQNVFFDGVAKVRSALNIPGVDPGSSDMVTNFPIPRCASDFDPYIGSSSPIGGGGGGSIENGSGRDRGGCSMGPMSDLTNLGGQIGLLLLALALVVFRRRVHHSM